MTRTKFVPDPELYKGPCRLAQPPMRLAWYLLATILCLLAAFVLMSVQRLALQDKRIQELENHATTGR